LKEGNVNQALIDAINQRRCVTLWYNGGDRIVEPHCYGEGSEGQELLRCFQVEGHSESGVRFGWKLMRVDEIQNVRLDGEVFDAPRADYNPNDKAMRTFIARLPASAITRPWR
jgi:hypothetical protein